VYDYVKNLYAKCFPYKRISFDELETYETALVHAQPILQFSSTMLNYVNKTLQIDRIKRWTLLPIATRSIGMLNLYITVICSFYLVHVPLSGVNTMYHVLKRAFNSGLPIPDSCKDEKDSVGLFCHDTIVI
jgi:hypothetical protein